MGPYWLNVCWLRVGCMLLYVFSIIILNVGKIERNQQFCYPLAKAIDAERRNELIAST